MKKTKIYEYLDSIAPFDLCCKDDNVGELIKGKDNVKCVCVALDMTYEAIAYAVSRNADMLITHHPVIYDPLYGIVQDRYLEAIKHRISVISMHTNYDGARLNDILAMKCGLHKYKGIFYEDGIYLGRAGEIEEMPFEDYIRLLKASLNVDHVKVTGKIPENVKAVAISCGSSGSFTEEILKMDPCVLVTGEIKYDLIKSIADTDVTVIELGHYESEVVFVDDLAGILQEKFHSLKVVPYKKRISRIF
jgi:dinuclear metal center YbgI/SA1388 family protein